jgi:hypothetical protein
MKKTLALLIVIFVAIPAFTQEDWKNERRTAITLNIEPLAAGNTWGGFGFGPGIEYAFLPQVSGKAQLFYMGFDPAEMFHRAYGDKFVTILGTALEARWYPMDNYVRGWFVAAGVQYRHLFGSFTVPHYSWGYDEEKETGYEYLESEARFKNSSTLGFYSDVGYKWVIGKNRYGFVIEPSLGYIWSVHFGSPSFSEYPARTAQALGTRGFRITVNLGIAF